MGPSGPTSQAPKKKLVEEVSFEGVGPLLVLRTAPGGASAVAAALDQAGWSELVGVVGTADTVLAVTRGEQARKAVERRIEGIRQR